MAQRVEHHPLEAAFAALLANGLDGAGEALRIVTTLEFLGPSTPDDPGPFRAFVRTSPTAMGDTA